MKRSSEVKHSHSVTLTLVMGGKAEKASALSPFGPVRAGLTTSQTTTTQLRMVSLKSWVKPAVSQPSRFSEDCVTLDIDIKPLAGRCVSTLDITGTDVLE